MGTNRNSHVDGGELYLRTLESMTDDPKLLAIITNQRMTKTAQAAGRIVSPASQKYDEKKVMHAVAPGGKNGYIHTVCGLFQGPKGRAFKYTYTNSQVTCPNCSTGKVVANNV